MWGAQNGGSPITGDSTVSHRSFAARKTPSHDAGRNGSPDSFSHSHSGSGPAGPSVKKLIRSATVASASGVWPTTPCRSRQCKTRRCRPVSCVTSRIGRSS